MDGKISFMDCAEIALEITNVDSIEQNVNRDSDTPENILTSSQLVHSSAASITQVPI